MGGGRGEEKTTLKKVEETLVNKKVAGNHPALRRPGKAGNGRGCVKWKEGPFGGDATSNRKRTKVSPEKNKSRRKICTSKRKTLSFSHGTRGKEKTKRRDKVGPWWGGGEGM